MDKYVYGADTETLHGRPMTMQFYSEDVACSEIHFVSPENAADTFLKWCATRKRNILHVVYVHNLSFDLPEFLWGGKLHAQLAGGEFDFKLKKWNVRGVYGTPTFCRVSNGHDITVMIVDSFSFFRGSLAKGAELFCPDLPKLKRVQGLGEKRFTKRDSGFVDYAMRDAEVSYHMGKAIEAMHKEFNVSQCVSIADLAGRIFRGMLTYTIPQPSRDIIEAALLSYHGGKNNITEPAGWYSNVTALDLKSAYGWAISELPAYSNGKLYKRYNGTKAKEVPPHGVYCVSGNVAECKWPVVFSHSFKPLHGQIRDVWIQGHEVNEALRSGELKASKIKGFYYDAEKDHQAPAFRHFVQTFYDLKEAAADPVLRYMYKTIPNSVYGKFIQTRKKGATAFTDIDAGVTVAAHELIAGGMFHPFIASDITAKPRALIHTLEHKYKAIHTATDGILAQNVKNPPNGTKLGSLATEARDATVLMIRNKLYIVYTKKGAKTQPSHVFKGKHIAKYALHGFQGNVTELEKLVATGRRKYSVSRPNRLKESVKRKLAVNEFVNREYTLKVGKIPLR